MVVVYPDLVSRLATREEAAALVAARPDLAVHELCAWWTGKYLARTPEPRQHATAAAVAGRYGFVVRSSADDRRLIAEDARVLGYESAAAKWGLSKRSVQRIAAMEGVRRRQTGH